MANITNNNFNKLNLKISKSEYWDFVLSNEKDQIDVLDGSFFFDDTLISFIDVNDNRCISGTSLYSINDYKWNESINNGLTLNNIGFTGIDNGGILFDTNTTSASEFYGLVTGSTLSISSGDTRLVLNIVSGNTGDYIYPISFMEDSGGSYLKLDGGFYQGFFKSGNDYSILPSIIQDEMSFEFVLKPDLIGNADVNTLNYKYPDNKGIFFYLGVRGENKFWYDYFNEDEDKYSVSKTGQTSLLDSDYMKGIRTSDGFDIKDQNMFDIKTDNKYLLFNRTLNGKVASNFDDNLEYHITGKTQENLNYYLYMNRTRTGYTVSSIDSLTGLTKPYSIIDDITNNAIAFRIKDNGSIGYRTINKSCEGGVEYIINEEYSSSNIIRDNELSFINVRVIMNEYSECGGSNRNFKLWFYVNGVLVFVSSELSELMFRPLVDTSEKQETIPYNISIGGGSQGLCDMIGFNTGSSTQYLLPIEQHFGGTLLGSIYKFRIFYGKTDYSKIKNNYLYQSSHIFNPGYIIPSVNFLATPISISSAETNYKREIGNTGTILNGSIILNDVYNPITNYRLYYYPNNSYRVQLNGLFPMPSYGGTIPEYIHNDLQVAMSGLTSIKYLIEVLDTYNNETGTEKIETIIFDNMIFYGTSVAKPTTSDEVRLLENRLFNSEAFNITLSTGARDKVFTIATPKNRIISSIIDVDAFMLNITNSFIKNEVNISDAGGNYTLYNVYTMENAIPYSRNHNLVINLI